MGWAITCQQYDTYIQNCPFKINTMMKSHYTDSNTEMLTYKHNLQQNMPSFPPFLNAKFPKYFSKLLECLCRIVLAHYAGSIKDPVLPINDHI